MGMDKNETYGWRILVSIDQSINTICGGEPDETISSRWGRAIRGARGTDAKVPWYARWGCAVLNRIDKDHCRTSIEFDDCGNPRPHHLLSGGRVEGKEW